MDKLVIEEGVPYRITDENGALHCLDGYAVRHENGGYYAVRGRLVPEEYFKQVCEKSMTMDKLMKIDNEEHKSVVILLMQEKYGEEYVADFFRDSLKEIDTFVDKKEEKYLEGTTGGMNVGVYTLLKGTINDSDEIAYVRCYCPSTDRMFFLGVEPHHTKADDAIASLLRIPEALRGKFTAINRQGERFSLVLNELGSEVAKKMSREDFEDTYTLTGKEYFNLMEFEF